MKNNIIKYTTSDHRIVRNFNKNSFGTKLLSNKYDNTCGILEFENEIINIGEDAFLFCEELCSITLPNSLRSIESGAFSACSNLTHIWIPENVENIGECAFGLCTSLLEFQGKFASKDGKCLIIDGILNMFALGCNLTTYTIPHEALILGWSSFSGCKLINITLHDKVTHINHSAFCGCHNLAHINIPNSVIKIGDAAFEDCINLKSLHIPISVTHIGNNAFNGCDNLTVIYDNHKKGVFSSSLCLDNPSELINNTNKTLDKGWSYKGDINVNSIIIPDGTTTINDYAVNECDKVDSIYIPDSIKKVKEYAFANCI